MFGPPPGVASATEDVAVGVAAEGADIALMAWGVDQARWCWQSSCRRGQRVEWRRDGCWLLAGGVWLAGWPG